MQLLGDSHYLTTFILVGTALLAPRASTAFDFLQTHDGYRVDSITEDQFLAAPFSQLCHSRSCFKDCLDHARLFQAVPDYVNATVQDYGQPENGTGGNVSVTLFGVCTNFLSAHRLVDAGGAELDPIRPFFTIEKHVLGVTDPFRQVALGVAACVSDTCGQTRNPSQCRAACGLRSLLKNDVRAIEWEGAMLDCTRRLCKSAQVLPYANQDVLGIGVLISYYIQGILLLVAAAGVLVSLACRLWLGQGGINSAVVQKLKSPMATFLTAETYFSISTAIAAFILSPRAIDPLNGYALMVVAIVGCLCPVFTLLLLHCLNAARVTRFGTALTLTSWLSNTVVFFMLLPNLSTFGDNVAEDALKQLFSVPTCGDSSAMSLCQQLTGDNPLQSLTGFFERSSWTNIRTIPVVWALTTVILLAMVADGARHVDVDRLLHGKQKPRPKEEQTNYSRLDETRQQESDSSSQEEHSPRTGRLIVAVVFIMLCSVGLGYSFHMVTRFRDVNAIDTHGWSFGQVVAAVFWVPVFLDVAHSMISG